MKIKKTIVTILGLLVVVSGVFANETIDVFKKLQVAKAVWELDAFNTKLNSDKTKSVDYPTLITQFTDENLVEFVNLVPIEFCQRMTQKIDHDKFVKDSEVWHKKLGESFKVFQDNKTYENLQTFEFCYRKYRKLGLRYIKVLEETYREMYFPTN